MYLSESTYLQLSNALSLIDLSQKLAEIHPLKVRYLRVLRVHFFTSFLNFLQLSNALSRIDLSQKLAEMHPLKVRYLRV